MKGNVDFEGGTGGGLGLIEGVGDDFIFASGKVCLLSIMISIDEQETEKINSQIFKKML